MTQAIVLTHRELANLFEAFFPCGCRVNGSDLDSKPYVVSGVSKDEADQFIKKYGSRKRDSSQFEALYISDATMASFLSESMKLPEGTSVRTTDFACDGLVAMLSEANDLTEGLNFMQAVDACLGGAFVIGSDFACGTYLFEHNGVVTVNPGNGGECFPFMATVWTVKQTYTTYPTIAHMPQNVRDAIRR